MGVDVIRSACNLEPKYRVTVFTREEWTRGPGSPTVVKRLACFTIGSRMKEGSGMESIGNHWEEGSTKVCYSFQVEVYNILACVYEIQLIAKPEKYVSIC